MLLKYSKYSYTGNPLLTRFQLAWTLVIGVTISGSVKKILECRNLLHPWEYKMYVDVYRGIKSSTVKNRFGYTGSKQVSSSDIAIMGIEDIWSKCTEHSCM